MSGAGAVHRITGGFYVKIRLQVSVQAGGLMTGFPGANVTSGNVMFVR